MNSIVMCSIVSICAAMVHRGGTDETNMESNMCALQSQVEDFINPDIAVEKETVLLIEYNVFSRRSELITKPVFQTLNEIKHQIEAATKQGANKTHCYHAAKLNATIVRKHAFDAMTVCGEKYMKVVKANVTLQFQLLKTALVRSAYTMSLLDENSIDQTITDKLTALKNQFFHTQKVVEAANFIVPSNNKNALVSCFGKVSSTFIADLQDVESDASACICTS